jgi:hypothetical protein
MSGKDNTVKVNKMEDLGNAVEEKKRKLGPQLPKLSIPKLATAEDITDRKQWVEKTISDLEERIAEYAEVLYEPERAHRQANDITEREDLIPPFVREIPFQTEREEVTTAVMNFMADLYPVSGDSFHRIATMGLAFGFFTEAGERVSDRQKVKLPTSTGSGFWEWKELTSSHPGSGEVMKLLQEKIAESNRIRQERTRGRVSDLREKGEKSFLTALVEGGTSVFRVPDHETDDGRFFQGGLLLVEVKSGRVHPIEAVAKFAGRIKKCVEDGVTIPADQVESERLNLGKKVSPERWKNSLFLHSLLHRAFVGIQEWNEQRERADVLQAQATVEWKHMLLSPDQPEGTSYYFLRKWWDRESGETHFNVSFLLERNEEKKVRVLETLPEFEALFEGCMEFALEDEQPPVLKKMLKRLESVAQRVTENGDENHNDNDENGDV